MSSVQTIVGVPIKSELLKNYFRNLVNQFFKILPMWENKEESLCAYMKSLQAELFGCRDLIPDIEENPFYLTLLSILQYLIDNNDCSQKEVRREVFKAISVCNKLKALYSSAEVNQ